MIRNPIEAVGDGIRGAKVSGEGAAARAEVPPERWEDAAAILKVQSGLSALMDLFCIDREGEGLRFEIVAKLSDGGGGSRFTLTARLPETGSEIASLVRVHPAAEWYERECFDMFGISFRGGPAHKRILTEDDFHGHPLRKDFRGVS
ncbi:MAG: NADH-quinone oxidoreductase subunit C [Proteobacteria bacterium]|nr:NADH-quinone oxidoreductase subunit C [Pseudomonadota bacterium]